MRFGLLITTVATLALCMVSPAMSDTINYVTTWTGIGTAPAGLEVDASGNVYVADIDGNQVLKYNSSGTLLQTIAPAAGDGKLNSPSDVAIGPDGSIYVSAAAGSEYVRKFASDGAYTTRWAQASVSVGIATDTSGNVYVSTVNGGINRYDASGTLTGGTWSGSGGNGLALNPSGTVAYGFGLTNPLYAVDLANNTSTVLASLIDGSSRGAVAVNSVTGNIYVAERNGAVVQEFGSDGTLIQNWNTWGSAGSQVSYSGTSSFGTIFGIAVNSATNSIYVADQSGSVLVFHESVPEPGTIMLLLTGLFGLLAYAWRKRK